MTYNLRIGKRETKMTKRPFTEKIINGKLIREFKENTTSSELVWHRDREDRRVTILEGKEWLLQLDNHIPTIMREGETYEIPKNTYHRIIKGSGKLVVEIKKKRNTMKITKKQLRRIIREEAAKAAPFGSGMEPADLDSDQEEIVGHT